MRICDGWVMHGRDAWNRHRKSWWKKGKSFPFSLSPNLSPTHSFGLGGGNPLWHVLFPVTHRRWRQILVAACTLELLDELFTAHISDDDIAETGCFMIAELVDPASAHASAHARFMTSPWCTALSCEAVLPCSHQTTLSPPALALSPRLYLCSRICTYPLPPPFL